MTSELEIPLPVNTPLGIRMKGYETAFRQVLPRRAYTLMRLDGRAFHTYLRNAQKPFDMDFVEQMGTLAQWLCVDIQGAQFAYTQSDEISILVTDFESTQSQPWVGGRTDKFVSLSAGLASAYMYGMRRKHPGVPVYDCRVWSMTDPVEVANYFVWRQNDAVTNSIQMLGQYHFTAAELHGKSCNDIQEMLFQQKGINWNDTDARCKRGQLVHGASIEAAPYFAAQPDNWLATAIPSLPSLRP